MGRENIGGSRGRQGKAELDASSTNRTARDERLYPPILNCPRGKLFFGAGIHVGG